ncbi:MAG: hypothetical protein HC828_08300 [Blastochloris sp.]|nr:hypothetical protein [Blastochloris sp.]
MMSEPIHNAIAQLYTTPTKLVLEFAGAGSLALYWLHSVPGSSHTILEATTATRPQRCPIYSDTRRRRLSRRRRRRRWQPRHTGAPAV